MGFPRLDGGTGDADAAPELGLAEVLRLAEFSDFFRCIASLTILIARDTLILLTVDALTGRSPLTWFYDKSDISECQDDFPMLLIIVTFASALFF